ncbi:MAG: 16S rRNA (guanine(527)-N(7))-methyltransferase RsmG [Bacilli bacterium]|nr:16S rRNA (guanine(527)-N(7))-methyltransferase RsmG [Bacilli bacterium]
MNWEDLRVKLWENGLPYEHSMIEQLTLLATLTLTANEKMNLTAIKELEMFVEKMIFDCALGGKDHSEFENKTVLDFGSGAGFPGFVIAILFPTSDVTLLDATKKKTEHLKKIAQELNLTNVKVVNARGEEFANTHREHYDYVIARAVAPLNILIELTAPLVKVGGELIAMKGKNGLQEYEESVAAIQKTGLNLKKIFDEQLPECQEERMNFTFDKITKTPKKYPRAYAEILAKPL